MSEVVIYLVKVMIIQAVCFGCYRLLFAGTLKHAWNRIFLLCSLLGAFFIPFVAAPAPIQSAVWPADHAVTLVEMPGEIFDVVPVDVTQHTNPLWSVLVGIYILIVLAFTVRSVAYLIFIKHIKKQSEYVKKHWYNLYKTVHTRPFSFFYNVFIPGYLFGSESFEQILAHECVHVKQLHSIDRLLVDFLVSLFWFNPFMYWYRNALIEIHEYQADEAVVQQFHDPLGYQEILFAQLQSTGHSGLVSHFNFSMIKKRIVMINKQKNKYAAWKYVMIMPLVLAVIFAFSSKEAIRPIEKVGNEISDVLGPVPTFEWSGTSLPEVYHMTQGDYTPSILPLRETSGIRRSSGFGMRVSPFTKERTMHQGVDFSTPAGRAVIATAEGVVSFSGEDGDNGNRIVLTHGDQFQTVYNHLSVLEVDQGATVRKGQKIGLSGNSGKSTAPHLHYEVIKIGVGNVDPEDFIKDYVFERKNDTKGKGLGKESPSILPIGVESDEVKVTSGYGYRMDEILNVRRIHHGIDFKVPVGTAVVATAAGKVDETHRNTSGYGYQILLDHGDGFRTRYAHLSAIDVKPGDVVVLGQVIGKSGNSGKSIEPHLHYEIIVNGKPVDPLDYIQNYDWRQQQKEQANLDEEMAERQRAEAHEQELKAEQQLLQSEEVLRSAEANQKLAEEALEMAEEQQEVAEQNQKLAEEKQILAEIKLAQEIEKQKIKEEKNKEKAKNK